MKRTTVLGSLALVLSSFTALAQQNVPRVDAARAAVDQTREFRGDDQFRADRQLAREHARAQYEIDSLNGDVRKLRDEMRGIRSDRIRGQFDRLVRDTDRLTALFRQDKIRNGDARHRAQNLHGDAARLRDMIRDYRRR